MLLQRCWWGYQQSPLALMKQCQWGTTQKRHRKEESATWGQVKKEGRKKKESKKREVAHNANEKKCCLFQTALQFKLVHFLWKQQQSQTHPTTHLTSMVSMFCSNSVLQWGSFLLWRQNRWIHFDESQTHLKLCFVDNSSVEKHKQTDRCKCGMRITVDHVHFVCADLWNCNIYIPSFPL